MVLEDYSYLFMYGGIVLVIVITTIFYYMGK